MQIRKVCKQHIKSMILQILLHNARLSKNRKIEVYIKKIIECEVIHMAHGNNLNCGDVVENPLVWGSTHEEEFHLDM